MSVIIIGTGGGHAALDRVQQASANMGPTERIVVQKFIDLFTKALNDIADDAEGKSHTP